MVKKRRRRIDTVGKPQCCLEERTIRNLVQGLCGRLEDKKI